MSGGAAHRWHAKSGSKACHAGNQLSRGHITHSTDSTSQPKQGKDPPMAKCIPLNGARGSLGGKGQPQRCTRLCGRSKHTNWGVKPPTEPNSYNRCGHGCCNHTGTPCHCTTPHPPSTRPVPLSLPLPLQARRHSNAPDRVLLRTRPDNAKQRDQTDRPKLLCPRQTGCSGRLECMHTIARQVHRCMHERSPRGTGPRDSADVE